MLVSFKKLSLHTEARQRNERMFWREFTHPTMRVFFSHLNRMMCLSWEFSDSMATKQVTFDEIIYPICGIAAYWAWSSSVMITAGIWPERLPDLSQIDWIANVVAHGATLFIASLFLRYLQTYIRKRVWCVGSATLISLGTLLILVQSFVTIAFDASLFGAIISGIGCGGALIYWACALMELKQPEAKRIIVSGSVIVGLIATVLILCLPFQLGSLVCVLLPFALLLCSKITCKTSLEDKEEPQETSSPSTRRFWNQISLYLCCFIMALAAGMYQHVSTQDVMVHTIDQWRTLHASVFMFVSIALFLDYRLQTTQLAQLFSQLIVPFIAGGLLIVSVVGDGFGGWGGVIMHTGYQLFLVYIYTEFALKEDISSKHLMVFVRGTIAIDIGLLGGFFFMVLTASGVNLDLRNVSLAVVYLLLLVGVLLFPNVIANVAQRRTRSRVVMSEHGERVEFMQGFKDEQSVLLQGTRAEAANAALLSAFASRYGFSPRELEIFEYLLRGKTLPAIASDAHLSYNTVKTHVSHIYQKMGVHTRNEMIDMVETWFSEQTK